jgi:signal transduction histidine kinase
MSAGTQLTPQSVDGALPEGRSLLAHLIHALNQPLTGLQCSMEVALAGPRQTEQYMNTLREGLTLTSRMRILVESIREVADQESERRNDLPTSDRFMLDRLLRETVADLHPVAESRNIQLLMACQPSLPVLGDRRFFAALLFRVLETVLSLAGEGTELRVAAARDTNRGQLAVSWIEGQPPEHSPFSRPELGLMIAQAGWQRAGAEWERRRAAQTQTCTIRLPLASAETMSGVADSKLSQKLDGPENNPTVESLK